MQLFGSEMLFFIVVVEDNRDCAIRCYMAWTTRILHLSISYFLSSNIMAVFINVKNYDNSCLFRTIAQVLGTNSPGTNRLRYQSSMGWGTNSPGTKRLRYQ